MAADVTAARASAARGKTEARAGTTAVGHMPLDMS